MQGTWATSGIDLHLDATGPRVRAGLEAALRQAIRDGRLTPGLRLPSSRTLAADLGIARNTAADAYAQLMAEGWLTARQGSGTFVASRVTPQDAAPVKEQTDHRLRFDLRPGSPDVSAFPRDRWLAAARRAVNRAPAEALGYTDPRGRPELRSALADYLARTRGVRVSAERIVICAGFTQALGLFCHALRRRGGTKLAVESYGQPQQHDIVRASGLSVMTVDVDCDGAVVENLGNADAALVTPAHQFPLGVALTPARRMDIVEWATNGARFVIEDDYDGEFRYDRQPVGALQALAPEHVVYCGTASKSLAPGLRLGWLVVPTGLLEDVVAAKAIADRSSSSLDQLTLAEFIVSGNYDRHVRRARLRYRHRRDRLVRAIERRNPPLHITGIAAGLHALLELPPLVREDDVIERAARHGLAIEGLQSYSSAVRRNPALVVGYGAPPDHAFTTALARLMAVLDGI